MVFYGDGYRHGAVKHSAKEFAYYHSRHGATHHTNTVGRLLAAVQGVGSWHRIHICAKYMQRYLDEFMFRANHREMKNAMFDLLIASISPR